MMRYLWLILACVSMIGCTRYAQPLTPTEQDEQEERMREFLDKSSPRNMNAHPKVTPEFTKKFNTRSSAQKGSEVMEPSKTNEIEEKW